MKKVLVNLNKNWKSDFEVQYEKVADEFLLREFCEDEQVVLQRQISHYV